MGTDEFGRFHEFDEETERQILASMTEEGRRQRQFHKLAQKIFRQAEAAWAAKKAAQQAEGVPEVHDTPVHALPTDWNETEADVRRKAHLQGSVEEAVFDVVSAPADDWYTAQKIAVEAQLTLDEATAVLRRFEARGIVQSWLIEDLDEEETLYHTDETYLTDEALKTIPGEFLRDLADAGYKRAQQARRKVIEEWEAQPNTKKAQDELEAALSNMKTLGDLKRARRKLETVRDQLHAAAHFVEEAINETAE